MKRVRTNDIWSIDDLELELRKLPGVRAAGFEEADDVLLVQLHVADRAERIDRSDRTDQPVPVSASRIAARHSDRPVAVEVVRWKTAPLPIAGVPPVTTTDPAPATAAAPEAPGQGAPTTEAPGAAGAADRATADEQAQPGRIRLLAVLAFPDTDEIEVHLILDGKRTIGRASVSSGTDGTVRATLDAVRDLGTGVQAGVRWSRPLESARDPGDGPGEHSDRQVVAVALADVDSRSAVTYGLAAGSTLVDAAARATLDALNRRLGREH